jgi:hypothetical protein
MRWLTATALMIGLLSAGTAHAAAGPRYDVPPGYTRCQHALALHGFFKWASVRHTRCREAERFMRTYAARAGGSRLPRHVDGYSCRIHYWRDEDDQIYASRHVCSRGKAMVRFYGMV